MEPGPDHGGLSPAFAGIMYRLVVTALVRASVVLIACMIMGVLSERGVAPYLPAAGLSFGLVGSFMLNHGLRAERGSLPLEAGNRYALAFVNYVIAFGAFLAAALVETSASS